MLFSKQDGVPGQDKWPVSLKVKGHFICLKLDTGSEGNVVPETMLTLQEKPQMVERKQFEVQDDSWDLAFALEILEPNV